jgi:hypothetical protein
MNHCGMSSHPVSDPSRIASVVNPTKQMALMNQTQQLAPATIAITVNQVPRAISNYAVTGSREDRNKRWAMEYNTVPNRVPLQYPNQTPP